MPRNYLSVQKLPLSQGAAGPVTLGGFWIDKYEVTNREFNAFVDGGGYRNPAFWTVPVRDGAREIPLDRAISGFVDGTGRPGPATWGLGTWREGTADHPVAGVSWYEAAAFCKASGKSLPTFFHWHRAATAVAPPDILAVVDFVVRSGRAVLFPVYKGSFDRFIDGAPYSALAPAALRDNLTWWSKDLGRSLDYLAERQDIDSDKLAYQGFSLGGCDALVCLALEPRFKAAVLIAGGLHGDHRYVPEDDPINFVPRIRMQVLLVGGRDDFVHPLARFSHQVP